jgi:hypothetical protein
MCKYGITLGFILYFSAVAFGQQADDTPFQVRFATSLKKQDALHITNTGATNAALCANVYALATSGTLLGCCSCLVPTNGLVTLALKEDVLENLKPLPKALVLKLTATAGNTGNCDGGTAGSLVAGMGAWKGEAAFLPSTLSAGEFARLTSQCKSLHATPNICAACRF